MTIEAQYAAFCATHPVRSTTYTGHQWVYREGGLRNAPAVLLLPGALGRPETSFEYITALEPWFRVIAPGYPAAAKTLNALCDGLAGLLDACRVRCAHVVGGSFGGLVAQALVRRHPHRVARLVLSDTSPPVPARALPLHAAAFAIRQTPTRAVRALIVVGVGRYVAALPSPARQFWRAHFTEMLAALTKAEIESRARIWAEFDQTPPAALPCRETLILSAESDRVVSPRAFRRLFPHARVHTVASPLGHAASIGDAVAYIEPIRRFLSEGRT